MNGIGSSVESVLEEGHCEVSGLATLGDRFRFDHQEPSQRLQKDGRDQSGVDVIANLAATLRQLEMIDEEPEERLMDSVEWRWCFDDRAKELTPDRLVCCGDDVECSVDIALGKNARRCRIGDRGLDRFRRKLRGLNLILDQDVFLGGEILVEGGTADSGRLGNRADARGSDTDPSELLYGGVEDPLASVEALLLPDRKYGAVT